MNTNERISRITKESKLRPNGYTQKKDLALPYLHELISPARPEYEMVTSPSRRPNHVLVVAPHADDEVEFNSALMYYLIQQSVPVTVAVLTDGRQGTSPYSKTHGLSEDELIQTRRQETRDALAFLGRENPLLNLDESFKQVVDMELGNPSNFKRAVRGIGNIVQQKQIDLVVAPHLQDYHPDHNNAAKAAIAIAKEFDITLLSHDKQFGTEWTIPEYAQWPDAYKKPDVEQYFKDIRQGVVYEPDSMLYVPAWLQRKKIQAVLQHQSQMYGRDLHHQIDNSNRLRGSWIDAPAAEVFTIVHISTREDGLKNPLSSSLPPGFVYRMVRKSNGLVIPAHGRAAV